MVKTTESMISITIRDMYLTGTDSVIVPISWMSLSLTDLNARVATLETVYFDHPYIINISNV